MTIPQFPKGFLFGTASSAYQIEGGWDADGRGPSIWDTYTHASPKRDNGDVACNTYLDFETDINLMSALGLNSYRFSVAWPRVLPGGKGQVNQKGLDYYNRLVDTLLAKNIRPFITLFHWDMPQALQNAYGGFAGRETASYFADYAEVVVRSLGDRAKDWITLNEPWEHAVLGHLLGEHAPGKTNPWIYLRVAHNQLLGHGLAVERIRTVSPDARVGITLSLTPILPKTSHPKDVAAARVADQFFNAFFLDAIYKGRYPDLFWSRARLLHPKVGPDDMRRISAPLDFLGVNFYSREFARHAWWMPFLGFWVDGQLSASEEKVIDGMPYTASGREVYPQGLYDLLVWLKNEYNNPFMYLTENGAAFTDRLEGEHIHDGKRVAYLQDYFAAASRAIADGVDLHGYFIWSLTDNFEWSLGYSTRFGIVYVDYPTQKRIVKDSGLWVREMIKNQRKGRTYVSARSMGESAMTEPIILAVDLGTSGMKVALITVSGKVLGWESEPVKLVLTPDGGAEQSPDEWWGAFLSAAGRLLKREQDAGPRVRAVCCSTQGEGTVPVDKDGNALMNCVLWMDMRGAPYLHEQFKGLVNVTGAGLRNTLRWIRLTGGMPSMTGKDPAAHMLLIRQRFPEVYEQTYKFLNVLDYLNLRLTGRFAATFDSILTSWVTDNRDPDAIRYAPDLVRDCGVDGDKLPEVVPCTAVLGMLKPDVAAVLGLASDVQVVAGAIDNTAAAIGAGAVEDYVPHLYIGTSSWMAAHVPFKKTDIGSSLASVPCAVPGRYLLTALQATAGGNLTYLRDNILYHKDELLAEEHVPDVFKIFDAIAARTPAGANGVLYTPWIWGERAPVEDRTLRAGLYNLSLNNTRADIIRAFLEGIAFNTRWLLAPVEKFLGRKVPSLNIVGGGAQSDVWCQIFSDVLDVEIKQVADPIYANARGAAWIGAVGLGEITFGDVPRLVQFKRTYAPDEKNRALYEERFAVFTQIYRQMKSVYKRLNT